MFDVINRFHTPLDFHPGPSEVGTRAAAAEFAQHVLKPAWAVRSSPHFCNRARSQADGKSG